MTRTQRPSILGEYEIVAEPPDKILVEVETKLPDGKIAISYQKYVLAEDAVPAAPGSQPLFFKK